MSLLALSGTNSVSGGYEIDNSCKFEADNAEKMTHTYDSAPTSQKKGTISLWFKRTEIGSNIGIFQFGDDASGDYLAVRWGRDIYGSGETYRMRIGGSTNITLDGDGAVRDTSAWYHMVIAIDTTQATASNRFKVYRNGAEVSMSTDNRSSLTQNTDMAIGENGKDIMIGEGVYKYNGYIAEVNYVDGQQLTPSDFGEYDSDSGIWIPKKYTGTYGNNGFYLDFSNASNLGEDQSGNNHDFTLTNITAADQATDTPTNNFATLNPLIYDINSGDDESYVLNEGATKIAASKSAYAQNPATIGLNIASGGKWYFEWTATSTANGSSSEGLCGLAFDTQISAGLNSTGVYNAGYAFYAAGFGTGEGYGANVVNGLLIDLDNNKIKWYKDGTLHVTMPDDGGGSTMQTSGLAFPYIAPYGSGYTILVNFGGFTTQTISSGNSDPNGYGNFEYPTQGGYSICTKNLAEFG